MFTYAKNISSRSSHFVYDRMKRARQPFKYTGNFYRRLKSKNIRLKQFGNARLSSTIVAESTTVVTKDFQTQNKSTSTGNDIASSDTTNIDFNHQFDHSEIQLQNITL